MNVPVKRLKPKRSKERSHIRNITRFAFCALLLIYLSGCYKAEVIKIKTIVNSKVDMREYKKVAVMDLVDSRENTLTNQGEILARMIRKQLGKSKDFHVLSEKDTYLRLAEKLDKDKISKSDVLVSICNQLGVDALIVGTFNLRQMSHAVPYIVERYSSNTGRYVPETRTYIQGVYRLSFHAKLVDGKTGETVFDYAPPIEERPKLSTTLGLPLPDDGNVDPEILRRIAARPVNNFVLSLVPHYEYEKRILVR